MRRGTQRRYTFGIYLGNGTADMVTTDDVAPTRDPPNVTARVVGGAKNEVAIVDLGDDVAGRPRNRRIGRGQPARVACRSEMMIDRQHVERSVVVDVQPIVLDATANGVEVLRQLAVGVLSLAEIVEQ